MEALTIRNRILTVHGRTIAVHGPVNRGGHAGTLRTRPSVDKRYRMIVKLEVPVSPIDRWSLDPAAVHLNHGSYGGCLRSVTETAAAWRAKLEAAPMRFLVLDWQDEIDRARAALAAFVGAPDSRLAFVPGTTTGLAIALSSTFLTAGDEILTTDHGYRAIANQLARLAELWGVHVVPIRIPVPYDADAFVSALERAVTPRTRLAVIDHITSASALRLPIERIVPLLRTRGIDTIVDGAHAPGQIELDLAAVDAAWYVGNCHKWLCAPKGSGFVVASERAAARLRPIVTSHGASREYGPANRFHAELDWPGTHDPSVYLSVPEAITAVAAEGEGWTQVMARNHALAIELRDRLIDQLRGNLVAGAPRYAPDDALGSMAAIPIALPPNTTPLTIQERLLRGGWEVAIADFATGPCVRLSAHLYNHAAEADALAAELRTLGVTLRPS